MAKDYLANPGMSAALTAKSIVNKSALSSGLYQNKALTEAMDFSRFMPKFDCHPCAGARH